MSNLSSESEFFVDRVQPAVELGLLFCGNGFEHHAHAQARTHIDNIAKAFEYFVVMGNAEPDLRAFWHGIQRVDIAA